MKEYKILMTVTGVCEALVYAEDEETARNLAEEVAESGTQEYEIDGVSVEQVEYVGEDEYEDEENARLLTAWDR